MKTTCQHCGTECETSHGHCPECKNELTIDTPANQTGSPDEKIATLKRVKTSMWIGIAVIMVIVILVTFIILLRGL